MKEHCTHSWFEDWFDSEYYHTLYKSRDETEAARFMDALLGYLTLPAGAHVMDLACGKGRHSRFLNSLGYNVLGVDLSENSIAFARQFESATLQFRVGDMREPQGHLAFDAVFNLFTSFGYFNSQADNRKTLASIHTSLKTNGLLVIDFMNSAKAIAHLQPHYVLEKNGVVFHINKRLEEGVIHKKIAFTDKGQSWQFEEQVQALTFQHFIDYFSKTGFVLKTVFGNYALEPFDEKNSDRMIFIAQKTA